MAGSQLLCTFSTYDTLDSTLKTIVHSYTILFDKIYVLENIHEPNSLCCTYNINVLNSSKLNVPSSTISLHRKKITNTLYTINALNLLIEELNNGQVDKNFNIPWHLYKNTIIVTAYNQLKKIETKLYKIVSTQAILEL